MSFKPTASPRLPSSFTQRKRLPSGVRNSTVRYLCVTFSVNPDMHPQDLRSGEQGHHAAV
jgi:hypothetical protein